MHSFIAVNDHVEIQRDRYEKEKLFDDLHVDVKLLSEIDRTDELEDEDCQVQPLEFGHFFIE